MVRQVFLIGWLNFLAFPVLMLKPLWIMKLSCTSRNIVLVRCFNCGLLTHFFYIFFHILCHLCTWLIIVNWWKRLFAGRCLVCIRFLFYPIRANVEIIGNSFNLLDSCKDFIFCWCNAMIYIGLRNLPIDLGNTKFRILCCAKCMWTVLILFFFLETLLP